MNKIVSVLVALAITLAPACSWFSHAETTVKADLINCAQADLGQPTGPLTLPSGLKLAGESFLMAVVAILAAGGTNWQGDLASLEAKYGGEALACAAQIAEDLFKPAPTTTPATADADQVAAYQRAQSAVATAAKGRKLNLK